MKNPEDIWVDIRDGEMTDDEFMEWFSAKQLRIKQLEYQNRRLKEGMEELLLCARKLRHTAEHPGERKRDLERIARAIIKAEVLTR